MKDYSVKWNHSDYPEVTREYLGILPEFFIHATQEGETLEQVAEAMDSIYGFGGFQYLSVGLLQTVERISHRRTPTCNRTPQYRTLTSLPCTAILMRSQRYVITIQATQKSGGLTNDNLLHYGRVFL